MRDKKKKVVWTLLLISIAVSMTAINIGSTSANALPNVSVDPPLIWDPSMGPGTQFTVDLSVDYVRKLWAYQLTLSFNPDVLQGVSVDNGPFLESRGGSAVVVPGEGFDNDAGTLWLFGAYLDPIKRLPTGGSDQYGPLATLTFEVADYGGSPITLGVETGLVNSTGGWITHKADDPDSFFDGYFDNRPGPQLWIREKHGTMGGGAYPGWHVNLAGEEQILYSKIASSGDMAAWVKVKFTVDWVEGETTAEYWSGETEISGVYIGGDGKKVYPLEIVATDPFMPGPEGKYTVTAALYFKAGGMTDYVLYELVESGLGGTGTARDPATKFKVAEQM